MYWKKLGMSLCLMFCTCVYDFVMQVKYDLTKVFSGDDDKETIHCEFDITDGGIGWLSGVHPCF